MTDPDRYAKAVYEAALNLQKDPDKPHEPWESLPEYWRATFRREASAVQELIAAEIEAQRGAGNDFRDVVLTSPAADVPAGPGEIVAITGANLTTQARND